MGRPLIEITPELCEKAQDLAKDFLNNEEIADSLGMGVSTLYEKKAEYPEFLEAIRIGKSMGIRIIKNKFTDKAKAGDNHCMTMILKNYSDLRDKTEVEIPKGFSVTIGNKDAGNL